MSILANIYKHTLARVLPLSSNTEDSTKNSRKRKIEHAEDKEPTSRRRKRDESESDIDTEVITKRRRVDNDHFAPIVEGETYEVTAIAGQQMHHDEGQDERTMMLPPALTTSKIRSLDKLLKDNSNRRASLDKWDANSQISFIAKSTQQRVADDLVDEHDMERARRHAAATTLPSNSGIWERGEKELFYHLSYRGFEPLFPANWMRDFRTMPLSLYQRPADDTPPLIQPLKLGEFRAIHELRDLLELGKNVRDKSLASPGVRRELIIERAINKYISWAVRDAGLQLPKSSDSRLRKSDSVLPIHVVVRLKSRQTTEECLFEMSHKLHDLADRHRRVRNIYASIERDEFADEMTDWEDETRVVESLEDDLPVLYGVTICKSVIAIFTMNSRTPALRQSRAASIPTRTLVSGSAGSVTSTDTDSEMQNSDLQSADNRQAEPHNSAGGFDARFIADFDLSDAAKDVWNALVIAILAMQIRRDLVLLEEAGVKMQTGDDIEFGIEKMSVVEDDLDDDDPDA